MNTLTSSRHQCWLVLLLWLFCYHSPGTRQTLDVIEKTSVPFKS